MRKYVFTQRIVNIMPVHVVDSSSVKE